MSLGESRWMLINVLTKKCITVNKPTMTAGRTKIDDIICLNTAVSRSHAKFILLQDALYVQDHGSVNGTYVNDTKILTNELYKLKDGDKVGLGVCEKMLNKMFEKYYIFQVSYYKVSRNGDTEILIIESDDEQDVPDCKENVNDNLLKISNESNGHGEESAMKNEQITVSNVPVSADDNVSNAGKLNQDIRDATISETNSKVQERTLNQMCIKSPDNCHNESVDIPETVSVKQETLEICMKSDTIKDNNKLRVLDDIMEIDDSEEDKDMICSQLYSSVNEKEKLKENCPTIADDIFSQIKKEVEELDRLTPDANANPISIVSDESSSDEWYKEYLDDGKSKKDHDDDVAKPNQSKSYDLPIIIEPHVLVNTRTLRSAKKYNNTTNNADEKKQSLAQKRKSAPVTRSCSADAKKSRFESLTNRLKHRQQKTSHTVNESHKEYRDLRETRKMKLKELALGRNSAKGENTEKKTYGVESKIVKEPLPSTSGNALPTSKPIQVFPYRQKVIVPQISTTDTVLTILDWQTDWLEQYNRNSRVTPNLTKTPAQPMRKDFKSYDHYSGIMIPLLTMEMWYSICKDYQSEGQKDKKNLITAEVNCSILRDTYTEIELYHTVSREDAIRPLKEEDLILVQLPYETHKKTTYKKLFGYVTKTKRVQCSQEGKESNHTNKYYRYFVTIMVKSSPDTIKTKKSTYVRFLTSITTHLRIFKSVKYLKHSPLCKLILRPNLDEFKLTDMEFEKVTSLKRLNSAQEQVVLEAASICLRDKPGLYLIKGPPGTGKTTVITHILYQILYGNHRLSNNTCILLAAPSNAAIDELVLRIVQKIRPQLKDVDRKRLKLLRVGPREMINEEARRHSLQELSKKKVMEDYMMSSQACDKEFIRIIEEKHKLHKEKNIKETYERYALSVRKFEEHILERHGYDYNIFIKRQEAALLNKANIICTTLSSCIRTCIEESYKASENRNNCLIVDEATQCQEPETLIPLILGINKVILVGDPQQLPATTTSLPARDFGYGESLFSRLEKQMIKKDHTLVRMLKIQYRMHPDICLYPNRAFYGNNLENSIKYYRTRGLEKLRPYAVLNLNVNGNYVYENDFEVKCVTNLIQTLTKTIPKTFSYSIGVITPYNHQKHALLKAFKQCNFKSSIRIAVNTVDSFQGKEEDIIILSCVRTDPNNFLADEKRLNVALTRAKSALYIFGAARLFDKCPVFGRLREDAESRKLVFNMSGEIPTSEELLRVIQSE